MTLSFVTRRRDELPETYTALSPPPFNYVGLHFNNHEHAHTRKNPPPHI
ncbi:hypothetical protein HmCmsJML030_03629 [Escherichia coli]|nr:hypothetical protein HmCmsJML030_03629 [Escherichia coli]